MYPGAFFFITNALTCRGSVWGMYEFQDVNCDVMEALVFVGLVKVSAYWIVQVRGSDGCKVTFEALFD